MCTPRHATHGFSPLIHYAPSPSAEINTIYAILYVPFTLKPLFSYLLPILTLRPLLLLSVLLISAGNVLLVATAFSSLPVYVGCNIMINLGLGEKACGRSLSGEWRQG